MSASTTERFACKLDGGRVFTVDLTETPGEVFLLFGGAAPSARDSQKIAELLWPILYRYEHDTRPIRMEGRKPGDGVRLLTLGPGIVAVQRAPQRASA